MAGKRRFLCCVTVSEEVVTLCSAMQSVGLWTELMFVLDNPLGNAQRLIIDFESTLYSKVKRGEINEPYGNILVTILLQISGIEFFYLVPRLPN